MGPLRKIALGPDVAFVTMVIICVFSLVQNREGTERWTSMCEVCDK